MVADGSVDIAAIWGEGIPTSNPPRMKLGQLREMGSIKAHFPAAMEEQEKLEEIKLSLGRGRKDVVRHSKKKDLSFRLQSLNSCQLPDTPVTRFSFTK